MGTPYKYGGSEKGKGTDCSGMVLKVYEKVLDKKLPRNSAKDMVRAYLLELGSIAVTPLWGISAVISGWIIQLSAIRSIQPPG